MDGACGFGAVKWYFCDSVSWGRTVVPALRTTGSGYWASCRLPLGRGPQRAAPKRVLPPWSQRREGLLSAPAMAHSDPPLPPSVRPSVCPSIPSTCHPSSLSPSPWGQKSTRDRILGQQDSVGKLHVGVGEHGQLTPVWGCSGQCPSRREARTPHPCVGCTHWLSNWDRQPGALGPTGTLSGWHLGSPHGSRTCEASGRAHVRLQVRPCPLPCEQTHPPGDLWAGPGLQEAVASGSAGLAKGTT